MTKIRILEDCALGDEDQVIEVKKDIATDYVKAGWATFEPKETIGKPTPKGEEVEDVSDYVKSGEWLTADNVTEGDEMIILGDFKWDDSFETRYLTGKVAHGNEEYRFRFGKRNTERIMDKYGPNPSKWKGKVVEVAAIESYKQLGTKGLILKPK